MDKWKEHTQAKDGNATEHSRLEGQHEVMIYSMGGKAVYAPVDFSKSGLQILDSGCANGRWLFDLKAASPAQHGYYGTDIDNPYPLSPPEDMHFQDQNIKEDFPAEWDNKFDLIHQRLVMAGMAPGTTIEPVIQKFIRMLKPGGWVQLIEMDTSPREDNSPMMQQFIGMLLELSTTLGLGNFAKTMKGLLEKNGMVDVREQSFFAEHGASMKDKSLVQKSIVSPVAAVAPILKVLKSVPNSFEDEQLDGFEDRLRKELEEQGANSKFLIVWGRKSL